MEDHGACPSDDLMDIFVGCLAHQTSGELVHRTFYLLLGRERVPLTISQIDKEIVGGETGQTTWPASYHAATMLIDAFNHQASESETDAWLSLKGKTVFELGCGVGLIGCLMSILGARRVVCTDGCSPVLEYAKMNMERALRLTPGSASRCQVDVEQVLWGHHDEESVQYIESVRDEVDIVVGCDCVYDPRRLDDFLASVSLFLKRPSKKPLEVWIIAMYRRPETFDLFVSGLEELTHETDASWELVSLSPTKTRIFSPGLAGNFGDIRFIRVIKTSHD